MLHKGYWEIVMQSVYREQLADIFQLASPDDELWAAYAEVYLP
jgi:hypothetical protein